MHGIPIDDILFTLLRAQEGIMTPQTSRRVVITGMGVISPWVVPSISFGTC